MFKKTISVLLLLSLLTLPVFISCARNGGKTDDTSAVISTTELTYGTTVETEPPPENPGEGKTTLTPDLYTAEYTEGETVLSVSWGESEDTLACRQNMEMLVTNGPQSFTVGDDGTVYIYDTFNTKLKAFKNSKLISSLNLNDINGRGDGVGIISMAYLDGSIYALELNSNKVYKITGSEIERMDGFREIENVERITSTPAGNLIICGNNYHLKYSMMGGVLTPVVDNKGYYESAEGNTVRISDYVFLIEDQHGEIINAVNINLTELTDISSDGNGFQTGMTLLGTDSKGRAYMELNKYKWNNYVATVDKSYLVRLDIENETIDTIEIPVAIKYEEMPISGDMLNSTFVASDGSVYIAYMSVTNGAKIIRFSFN